MKLSDIEQLVLGRIGTAGIAGLQLVFPNVPPDPDPPVKPYAVCSVTVDQVEGLALDGSANVTSGRLRVVLVVAEGAGNLVASQLRDTIAALYPMGLRILGTAGTSVEFRQPPQPKTGYEQGGNWRLPLEIPFSA